MKKFCSIALLLIMAAGCSHRQGKPRVFVFTNPSDSSSVAGMQSIYKTGNTQGWDIDSSSDAARFVEDSLKNYSAIVFLDTNAIGLNQYQRADFQRYIQAGGGFVGIHAASPAKHDWAWYNSLVASDKTGGSIKLAIGDNAELDYSKATVQRTPEEDRFTKVPLAMGQFFEPTEMTILPNFDILVAQRRGEILLYSNTTKKVKQAGFLNVYFKTLHTPDVRAEEGLLGIQADPDFANNHYVYIYYSPVDTSVNRLSRFTLVGDSIDNRSEKMILQLYSQREICCHTGGSIAFGNDNLLFLSTGDNSTPFDEPNTPYANHGFGPLDDRPGHQQYDSRRGAGNTNDLRGKILRIKINADGTYGIPEGNLFPKGQAKTRPEIYVMGDRNPYRISVDKKNGYLYWGEVGPDAGQDSLDSRGPRGYDEFNQARKAGFFGWPYFVGDNYAYHLHDYATNTNGSAFDPQHPVNDSRNNTGLRELPPAQPAFVWYPYAASPDFPGIGSGGRCAMAGPVFHADSYPEKTRYPAYYDGKWFAYDFTRCWFRVVTMLPNGDFDELEPFMEHTKWNSPIDVEMGPDGRLYTLEYGTGWFSQNADAGISRIDYNSGNRSPKLGELTVNKTSGELPLHLSLSIEAKDPEKDSLHYVWRLGDAIKQETSVPNLDLTLTTAGDYAISVEVKDGKSDSAISNTVNVYAGNEAPFVSILLKGNKTFYFPGTPVTYSVNVTDKEDTVTDKNDLVVSAEYLEGSDKAASSPGHQTLSAAAIGKNLTLSLDCKTCHKVDEKSIGPSFHDVALRYQKDPNMVTWLVQKIAKGGSGKWGEVMMPAHPTLKDEDIKTIIGYIQTLAGNSQQAKSLPASGTLKPTLDQPEKDKGILTISATYTDKGGTNIKPLSTASSFSLRNSKLKFGRRSQDPVIFTDSVDLATVKTALLLVNNGKDQSSGTLEIRLGNEKGKKIGEFAFNGTAMPGQTIVKTRLSEVTDGLRHRLYITRSAGAEKIQVMGIQFGDK